MICTCSYSHLLLLVANASATSSTIYQAQFQGVSEYGPNATGVPKSSLLPPLQAAFLPNKPTSSSTASTAASIRKPSKTDPDETPEPPLPKHVFQTIFLDREDSEHLWSREEINKDEVILTKWWKQQSHRWQHCESGSTRWRTRPSVLLTFWPTSPDVSIQTEAPSPG